LTLYRVSKVIMLSAMLKAGRYFMPLKSIGDLIFTPVRHIAVTQGCCQPFGLFALRSHKRSLVKRNLLVCLFTYNISGYLCCIASRLLYLLGEPVSLEACPSHTIWSLVRNDGVYHLWGLA